VRAAGIDGTKDGWVALLLENGRVVADSVLSPIETDFAQLAEASVLAIDVPIGFGPRQADLAARAFLSGAASTVFTTPSEEILRRPFGPGLGVSAQAHALGRRILHVTALAQSDPRFYEVHPDVSFRAMNEGRPLRHRKKSAGGAFERIELLAGEGLDLGRIDVSARVPLDDVLDAAAAAWSAHRIATGRAQSLPEPPEIIHGRQVAIWV
jgi:predicted RNase H-like nuclease